MTDPAITIDGLQTLQVALHFAPEIAFDWDFAIGDRVDDFVQLLRGKILRPQIWVDIRLFQNAFRRTRADTVNVSQGRFDPFVGRNFNS